MKVHIFTIVKKHKTKSLMNAISLAVLYVFFSLIIGEFHPFSKAEMYNSFPDNAQAICLTNTKQQYIAIANYFNYRSDDLTHNYHSLRQNKKVIADSSTEIGARLWHQLSAYRNISPLNDTLQIVLVDFFIAGDSINFKKTFLYEGLD